MPSHELLARVQRGVPVIQERNGDGLPGRSRLAEGAVEERGNAGHEAGSCSVLIGSRWAGWRPRRQQLAEVVGLVGRSLPQERYPRLVQLL